MARDEREPLTADEVLAHAPAGVAVLGLDGRFLRVNPALCALLDRTEAELLALTADDVVDPAGRPGPPLREAVLAAGHASVERCFVTPTGHQVWASVRATLVTGDDAAPRAIVAQIIDVSDRKRLEDALRHAADHDALTGLANRRRFEIDLAHQVERCRRYEEAAAVVLLDLDHLKRINDTQGHAAGDALLVGVAQILRGRLRASDVVARLGGDEFAAILPHARRSAALMIARSLVTAVEQDAAARCTASAGVVCVDARVTAAPDVIAAADRALYAAKRGGRNRAVLG